jgi:septal ring factor EnvC (AmiA/AmiB activator)
VTSAYWGHTRRRLVEIVFLALCLLGDRPIRPPAACAEVSDLQRRLTSERVDLARIERELQANKREIDGLEGKRKEIVKQISLTNKKIGLLQEYLRGLRREEEELMTQITKTEGSLRRATRRQLRYQRDFSHRLVRIYKRRKVRLMELLLRPGCSFSDFFTRQRYLAAIARQDGRDFERVKRENARIEGLRAELSEDYQKKLALDRQTSAKERALEEGKRSQQALQSEVQDNIALRRELAQGLEADRRRSQAAIERIIEAIREEEATARLQSKAQKPGREASPEVIEGTLTPLANFPAKRGKLSWPATGRVITFFGRHRDAKLKTWTLNRGIDIDVPAGTRVKAVASGRAVMTDWFRGYGKFVLLYHGADYFTLYGCLSEVYVHVGTVVDEGQVIARSGDTGAPGQPKLHFEVLEGKEAVDPLLWLRARG